MRILFISIFTIFSYNLFSQYTYFNNVYVPSANASTAQACVFANASEFISIGYSSGGILRRIVDVNGLEQSLDFAPIPYSFLGTTPLSENYLMINNHYVAQQSAVNNYQQYFPYITYLNESFDTIWTWRSNWPMGEGENFAPFCLTQIDNGNLLTVSLARYGDFGGVDNPDSSGFRLTQINLEGDVVYNHVQILPESEYCGEFLFSGAHQINDFLIMWGYTYAECGTSDRQNFFLKTDLTGEILDVYYFGNPDNCMDWMGSATITTENHIVFTYPRCIDDDIDSNILHQQQIVEFNPITWQLISDESLDIADWNTNIGIGNNESLIQSPDGALVTTGYMYNSTGDYPIVTPRVFKAKTNGELQWHYEYLSGLDSFTESFFDIANTPDGGYVMTGTVELLPTLSQRHWMVKIDSCGYEQPGFCFPDAVVERENTEVKLWPNPTHHVLKAHLPVSAESVELYNAAGRIIFSEKVYHRSQQWNIRDLECGVYYLRVLLEDGSLVTERVVKV